VIRPLRLLALGMTLCGIGATACAPRVDARFAGHARQADELYVHGRYREAAEAWLAASRATSEAHDRDEAVYRAAKSYERAGSRAPAEALLAGLARGPRRSGRPRGLRSSEARVRAGRGARRAPNPRGPAGPPESGVAPQALRTLLSGVEAREGEAGALARCDALRRELAATELDETLGYECAARRERRNDLAGARDGYLTTATRHPYPHGALWDDALTGAARCEQRLGRPREAVALLERLLAEREHSVGVGSYERSRYAEARFHIAELYRDELGDPVRARAEFHRVAREHETSLLVDDALFEAALLEARAGDAGTACTTLRSLSERDPKSRFVGCGRLVCASAPASQRGCPEATKRRF
jgi:tetratricopeptide (TPR) repeat protein